MVNPGYDRVEFLTFLCGLGTMAYFVNRRELIVKVASLSPLIRNYGNVFAVIFFPAKALSVEWIRYLISFFDRIYRIIGIFFACGEILLGRRPFYLNNPVNPV